ncbi:MAG: histidinol-phosphate aminotransferase [Pseudonocardiales bacterium]|nr:histidinol-phosphate aminotransferase [Pseudonocardiales bacterium]
MDATIRADLDAIPAYAAGRTVPGSLKLASNEISLPPPPAVLAAIAAAAAAGNRYPDPAVTGLTARLAERHGLSADRIAVGCGSVLLCQQLVQIVCGSPDDEVIYAWRSFEAYPIVVRVSNARNVTVPLDAEYRHDLKAMAAAITPHTRLVFLCTPNNPTGMALRRDELCAFLDEVPANVLVVLDEAYHEFVTDPDVPDGLTLLDGRPNVVVLRTFSKAYRLAGLRVGYAVGDPSVIGALRKVYPAFSVNSLAQAAASAALDCLPELLGTCAEVTEERTRVRDELLALGFEVPASQANFVWLPLGERTTEFAAHCERERVILRPFAGDGVRVTVAGADENDAFLAAARKFAL